MPKLWLFLIFAVLVGLLWQFYPLSDGKKEMEKLPLVGPGFYGKDIPLTEFEKTQLNQVGLIKRLYRTAGNNFFITILDGTYNRHAVHDPRFCFRGDGWDVVSEKPFKTLYGEANLFTIKKQSIEREALVWYTQGDLHFSSPMEYWFKSALRRLTLGYSGPEPLLVIVQPSDTPKPDWDKLIENFKPLFSF